VIERRQSGGGVHVVTTECALCGEDLTDKKLSYHLANHCAQGHE